MEFKVGENYDGKVKTITGFGAFVTLPGNRTGLVHISEVAYTYVSDIRQYLTEGQEVTVQVLSIDENGKMNLSIKRTQPQPEKNTSTKQERQRTGADSRPQQAYRPPQNSETAARSYAPVPSGDQAFEEKLKAFMSQSDSRLADARQYNDRKTKTRRR